MPRAAYVRYIYICVALTLSQQVELQRTLHLRDMSNVPSTPTPSVPVQTEPATEDNGPRVGNSKIKRGLAGLMNVIHGTGDVIRGIITKIADIGSGNRRGGQIVEDGKQEVREGVREITT
ncbi:hypothetical protein BGW80DRAFT_1306558 [Lactifluus volemus]|nr:hypothetical protein BGW80DRAFT_1306558 [Lactifluus volemus]